MDKSRNSNIELFRVLCMTLILMCHFVIFSGMTDILTVNKIIVMYSYWGGQAGNVGFIAISAFFLDKYQFKIEKVIRLFSKTTLYSIMWLIIALEVFHYSLSSIEVVRSILPTFYGAYEYAHVFLLIQFLSPFIKKQLENSSKIAIKKFLLIFGILFMFLPYILLNSLIYMDLFTEYIYIYILVWYLKHYEKEFVSDKKKLILVFGINSLLMFLFSVFCLIGRNYFPFLTEYSSYWAKCGSIFITLAMVSLFFFFESLKLSNMKFINILASSTFGVYLLHAPYAARTKMYIDYLHTDMWGKSYSFIIKYMVWIVAVFLICALIDLVFSKVFRRITQVIKKLFKKQIKSINQWMNEM